jgi:hypothetical protein
MRRLRRSRGDRGASSIELALLTPVLLVVIAMVIQFALLYHARHVALAAAQAGARVARSSDTPSWQQDAEQRAYGYVDLIGPGLLERGSRVALASRWVDGTGAPMAGVQVSGTAPTIVPGLHLDVVERSQGPVESFEADS